MKVRNKRIADFAKVVAGGTPTRGVKTYYEGGEVPWIKTLDLNCATVKEAEEHITAVGLESIRGRLNPIGTVMVAMYGGVGTIGKSGVLGIKAATNQAVASILPNAEVFDSDFLHFQLRHLRGEWMRYSQGNRKDPNINKSVVEDMLVWLPDCVDTQKSIGKQLKSQLATVEDARQAATAQLNELTHLAKAILRESLANIPYPSRRIQLLDVAREDRCTIAPHTQEALARPYLGLEHIEAGTGKILSSPADPAAGISNTFAFDNRHVLYGKLRPYLNKVALPAHAGRCTTEVLPILPFGIDRKLLAYLLRSEPVIAAAMNTATGSRMPRADMDAVWQVEFEIPANVADQATLAAHLRTQLAAVEDARQSAEAQLCEIERLPQRLLAQVFDLEEDVENA